MPTLTIQGLSLERHNEAKYLGLILDQHLTWDAHISALCKKLRPKVGLLSRLRHVLPHSMLRCVYNTTIQSVMDYGLTVWGTCNKGNHNAVQKMQNRCARLLSGNFDRNVCSRDLLASLGIPNINQRFNYMLGVLVYKCFNGMAPNYLSDLFTRMNDIHEHHSRNGLLQVPLCQSNSIKRSFTYTGTILWNSLPPSLKDTCSVNVFKIMLRDHTSTYF